MRKDKCTFMTPSVIYLGHKIEVEVIHPVEDKVKAIVDALKPQNVQELKSYLEFLFYYSKFMPNLPMVLVPLHRLLRKDLKWL